MQIGQVPIQFIPEAPVNDTRSVTMEANVTDSLIPSLAPFAPEPVAVAPGPPIPWLAIGGLLLVVWFMARKPGR